MSESNMHLHVETLQLDGHGSVVRCKQAEITLDTDLAARRHLHSG
jgi:hypothetical protein